MGGVLVVGLVYVPNPILCMVVCFLELGNEEKIIIDWDGVDGCGWVWLVVLAGCIVQWPLGGTELRR